MVSKAMSPFNVFLMLCLILFWGSSFVVVKNAFREDLTPIAIATFRFLVAGGLFLATLLVSKARRRDYALLVKRADVPTLLLLAVSGVTFFFTIQYTGIKMAGASIAAILVCFLSPILISVLSSRIFKEKLARRQYAGIGVAAAGTLAVIGGGTMDVRGGSDFFVGSLILLLTPLLWTAYTLTGQKIIEKYSPFLVVAYVNMLGGLFLVPFSFAENSFHEILTMDIAGWSAILFLAFTCSLVGYFIWFYVVKHAGAAIASSFLFGEPLVTVLFATIFVGEKITPFVVVGGLLTFAGVYLVTKK